MFGELTPDGESPPLRLIQSRVVINSGDSFNSLNYVSEAVDDED